MEKCNMKSKLSLESFVIKTTTKDGYSVIIGGFCPYKMKEEAITIYQNINNMELGQSKDEFLIDYILANAMTKLSPKWISLVGASICIGGVKNSTGGIIGNPFKEHESSDEFLEEINEGLYLISFPGGPGIAYAGSYSDGLFLRNTILNYKTDQNRNIKDITNKLDEITNLYILVVDGCGLANVGGIYVSDSFEKKHETFCL
jgi:hypothetical protein